MAESRTPFQYFLTILLPAIIYVHRMLFLFVKHDPAGFASLLHTMKLN